MARANILRRSAFIVCVLAGIATRAQTWTNLISGAGSTGSDYVLALAADSSTNLLYIGGTFTSVSGQPFANLVKWNGSSYANVGADGGVTALARLNGNMYAGGGFSTIGGVAANRVAKYNGVNWSPLGAGTNGGMYAFAWYQGLLYAGGGFSGVNGFSTAANHIATWNGTTWASVGIGANNGTTASGCCLSGDVNALAVYNNNLYVGGEYSQAGTVTASSIARWNGSTWSALTSGVNGYVTSLAVYGGQLYVGGNFTTAGGVNAHYIARWNGSTWSAVGPPGTLNNPIWAMEVINSELYVAGSFSGTITPGTSRFVSKWNGTNWSNVTTGTGPDNVVFAIAGVPTGWVYAGGGFLSGDGNSNDIHVARLALSVGLPIRLIEFRAQAAGSTVRVEWATATEQDNDHFSVQRSTDGETFATIGTVKGAGNSEQRIDYAFTDDDPPGGTDYYRLLQTDVDGTATVSDVVAVSVMSSGLVLFPVPVEDQLNIGFGGGDAHTVVITDICGRTLMRGSCSTHDPLDVHGLAPGAYTLSLFDAPGTPLATRTFVKK